MLHIQRTVATSQIDFPQSLFMYHLLDGANSNGEARALKGTISLKNHSSEFSEVLWVLAYWKGECPVDDQSLAGANVIWTEIQKNPTQSEDTLSVDLHFPNPLPMTGCVGFIFAGGPLVKGAGAVTMSAGHLMELYGSISDSTFDGTQNFGPLPTGEVWGNTNNFYPKAPHYYPHQRQAPRPDRECHLR